MASRSLCDADNSGLKEFLDAVVIPALVKAYLLENGSQNPLAIRPNDVTHSVSREST
jgi:hypothetical protein